MAADDYKFSLTSPSLPIASDIATKGGGSQQKISVSLNGRQVAFVDAYEAPPVEKKANSVYRLFQKLSFGKKDEELDYAHNFIPIMVKDKSNNKVLCKYIVKSMV